MACHTFVNDTLGHDPLRINIHPHNPTAQQGRLGGVCSHANAHSHDLFMVDSQQLHGRNVHHDIFILGKWVIFQSPPCPLQVAERLHTVSGTPLLCKIIFEYLV